MRNSNYIPSISFVSAHLTQINQCIGVNNTTYKVYSTYRRHEPFPQHRRTPSKNTKGYAKQLIKISSNIS
jgi:hypothetical protein